MRKMLCIAAAVAVCIGCIGAAAAVDAAAIAEIQAKLAAQEARLSDLQAKMAADADAGAPEQMTSMQKNAKVSVGGLLTTGYFYNSGSIKTDTGNGYVKTDDVKAADLTLSDVELEVAVDVNEHMDAYLLLDLHTATEDYGAAKAYWVRWKNIRDTGFGLKVGRDNLVFGDGDATTGYLYNFAGSDGDGASWWWDWDNEDAFTPHNMWDYSAVTQIAPYWESSDGKWLLEASVFANLWNNDGPYKAGQNLESVRGDGSTRIHSRNYGVGSMTARATWTPVEDFHITASAVNYHTNGVEDWAAEDNLAKNNTAVSLSFAWRPCFFSRMNVWAQYVHGWNVNHFDGADSDAVNYGVSFDLTDRLTVFAQGDWMRYDYEDQIRLSDKSRAWAAYAGVAYDLGNGASVEAGWRHEKITRDLDNAATRQKIKNDMIYAALSFEY